MYYHNYFRDIEEDDLDSYSWLSDIISYLTRIMLFEEVDDSEIRIAIIDVITTQEPECIVVVDNVTVIDTDVEVSILGEAYLVEKS